MTEQNDWPALPRTAWAPTCDTMHMYAQIIGKIRLALSPAEPQWAHVPFYVSARGLTTGLIPYGEQPFEICMDLTSHSVDIRVSDGRTRSIPLLPPRSVAQFFAAFTASLRDLTIEARIRSMTAEVPHPVAFADDHAHASYDPDHARRFHRILTLTHGVFSAYRAPFGGRHSPVHFFWGTFDLAYARFSGRPAPPPAGADSIMRNAMNAQEIAAGFWPGDDRFPEPAFYCYAYPKPAGIEQASLRPAEAFWHPTMGEFLLRYEDVRHSPSPAATIRAFLDSTYEACVKLADWERTPTYASV